MSDNANESRIEERTPGPILAKRTKRWTVHYIVYFCPSLSLFCPGISCSHDAPNTSWDRQMSIHYAWTSIVLDNLLCAGKIPQKCHCRNRRPHSHSSANAENSTWPVKCWVQKDYCLDCHLLYNFEGCYEIVMHHVLAGPVLIDQNIWRSVAKHIPFCRSSCESVHCGFPIPKEHSVWTNQVYRRAARMTLHFRSFPGHPVPETQKQSVWNRCHEATNGQVARTAKLPTAYKAARAPRQWTAVSWSMARQRVHTRQADPKGKTCPSADNSSNQGWKP